jgi:hypothetical protein
VFRLQTWPNYIYLDILQIQKALFTIKFDLKFRKKLEKYYTWSRASYGAETWTLRNVGQKYLDSFEMWCWRRIEKISQTDRVRNEKVLHIGKEERNIPLSTKQKESQLDWSHLALGPPSETRYLGTI